jgi:hypothetical protein
MKKVDKSTVRDYYFVEILEENKKEKEEKNKVKSLKKKTKQKDR